VEQHTDRGAGGRIDLQRRGAARWIKPQKRTARKGAAGVMTGWDHVCRRFKGQNRAGHTTRHPDAAERDFRDCAMRLWATPIPKKVTFHGLRHSAATTLLRAGVDLHRVQLILRHATSG
jgi:integrase